MSINKAGALRPTIANIQNSAANTVDTILYAGRGQLVGGYLHNKAAAIRYLKLYDKATAPTGSDTPMITVLLPASMAAPLNIGAMLGDDITLNFKDGLGVRVTAGYAAADTAVIAAADITASFIIL